MNIGDFVCRKSYNRDIRFVIKDLKENTAILSGIDYRLIADAKISDLVPLKTRFHESAESSEDIIYDDDSLSSIDYNFRITKYKSALNNEIQAIPINISQPSDRKCGVILHIDGDKSYLNDCLLYYKKRGVACIGINITENHQPSAMLELLETFNPNILVITGHDSLSKKMKSSTNLDDYKNSKYFVQAVEIARHYNKNYDDLVIIAGGCKSYYEAIMNAGANFASSPNRSLINVIDPVYVACRFATCSIHNFLEMDDIAKDLISITGSIGGIETRGQCRKAKPNY